MRKIGFDCGCYYVRDGRTFTISAHGGNHPNIKHVWRRLPLFEMVRARAELLANELAWDIQFKAVAVLYRLRLVHPIENEEASTVEGRFSCSKRNCVETRDVAAASKHGVEQAWLERACEKKHQDGK